MAMPKPTGKYIKVCIETDIYAKLEEFCMEARQSKSIAAKRALLQDFENYGAIQAKFSEIESLSI